MELNNELLEMNEGFSFEQLNGVFRDITLSIGGVFYAYPVPDEAVWEIACSLDRIFRQILPSSEETGDKCETTSHSQGRKHPAIVELLRKLKVYESQQLLMDTENV
ncbi:hypothetical protein H8D57_03495 [bacterium]|nr:hypothetical protein [bacterium]